MHSVSQKQLTQNKRLTLQKWKPLFGNDTVALTMRFSLRKEGLLEQ
jgi:hypothetical protein